MNHAARPLLSGRWTPHADRSINQAPTARLAVGENAAARLALRAQIAQANREGVRSMVTAATSTMYADLLAAEIVSRMPPLPRLDDTSADEALRIAVQELRGYGLDIDAHALAYAVGVQVGIRMGHLLRP